MAPSPLGVCRASRAAERFHFSAALVRVSCGFEIDGLRALGIRLDIE